MSAGSPVPSLDIRRHYGQLGADNAIPGLDIDPPHVVIDDSSKPAHPGSQEGGSHRSEGFGGWISNMVSRNKGQGQRTQGSQYSRLGQDEENE